MYCMGKYKQAYKPLVYLIECKMINNEAAFTLTALKYTNAYSMYTMVNKHVPCICLFTIVYMLIYHRVHDGK